MTTQGSAPDIHAAGALVERLFGAVLATMDLHAVPRRPPGLLPGAGSGPMTSAELAGRTGTAELRRYAVEAGFADVEILDIANDFFRFYRLR
jgi:hypothetical protein